MEKTELPVNAKEAIKALPDYTLTDVENVLKADRIKSLKQAIQMLTQMTLKNEFKENKTFSDKIVECRISAKIVELHKELCKLENTNPISRFITQLAAAFNK